MTTMARAGAARLAGAIADTSGGIPVLTGGCGAGRTSVLLALRDRLTPRRCQYVDIEHIATTPERFFRALTAASPFRGTSHLSPAHVTGPREAFEASLAFLCSACTTEGEPATFLLDEILDLRTFESFPGLRSAVTDLVGALGSTPNRFVLATRFATRAARLAASTSGRLDVQPLSPLSVTEVSEALAESPHRLAPGSTEQDLARAVLALTTGRPGYLHTVLEAMSSMADQGGADPVGALVAGLSPGGPLAARCRFSYELRLHRARGYGALKAILDVLAEDEPLTLTAIAQRLGRTPGSTKDYLGWLEDVDLITVQRKRYRVADPLIRLWIRVHGRPSPPSEETVVVEVQRYAMLRLAAAARDDGDVEPHEPQATRPAPPAETAPLVTTAPARPRPSGIIEFD